MLLGSTTPLLSVPFSVPFCLYVIIRRFTMALLLAQRGDEVTITEEVDEAAAGTRAVAKRSWHSSSISQRTWLDRLGVRGFTSVLEGVYRRLVLL
jgi:hypothetical protein